MTELFLKILNMSISATWLVLAVLLLRFLMKKAPKWCTVLLWSLVALRLLCPFSLESALSLIPSAQTIPPDIMLDSTPEIHTGVESINSAVNPMIADSFTPNPAVSANPLQIWLPVCASIWILGITLMTLYTLLTYLRLHRRVRMAIRAKDNIYLSEYVSSPFVLGIFRPRIYLPYHMDELDRFHVIAHERAHIRRKDHLWKPLGFLLLTIHWFNPVMWLSYILLCRDIELACDERVIRELGVQQRADYSQALLNCSIPHRAIAACPLAFGEVGVKERVKNVLRYRKPSFWIILISLILCTVAAVCFLTDPLSGEETTPYQKIEQVVSQNGFRIISQESQNLNLVIEKDWLSDACLTEKGETFGINRRIPYHTYADNQLYLSHVGLSEDPQYLRFRFDFNVEDLDGGKLLLPYRVDHTGSVTSGFLCNVAVNRGEVWDNQKTYTDAARFEPTANGEGFCVLVKKDVFQAAGHHIAFMLNDFQYLTYEKPAENFPQNLVGKTFQVTDVSFPDPRFSSLWTHVNNPYFAISKDCHLLTRDASIAPANSSKTTWQDRGPMSPMTLTKENFDDLFYGKDKIDPALLRQENQQAWSLLCSDETGDLLYYLLRQKNNDLYLAYGHETEEPLIRWLLKLEIAPSDAWEVSMIIQDVTATGAFLVFHQTGAIPEEPLQYGSDYSLQVLWDERWKDVPFPEGTAFTTVAHTLEPDGRGLAHVDWSDTFGRLPQGTYRIGKNLSSGGQTRTCYAAFVIDSLSGNPITFDLQNITPLGLDLYIRETLPETGMYVTDGGVYLQMLTDSGWAYVPAANGTAGNIPTTVHISETPQRYCLDWSDSHGKLPMGTYRICQDFTLCDAGLLPIVHTVYGEFSIGNDWGLTLMVNQFSETSVTGEFRFTDDVPPGQFYYAGATVQARDRFGWKTLIPMGESPENRSLAEAPGFSLLWEEEMGQLSTTGNRIGIRVKYVPPSGEEEYLTICETFYTDDWAWDTTLDIDVANPKNRLTQGFAELLTCPNLPFKPGELTYTEGFRLEKRANNQWNELPLQTDPSWSDKEYVLSPGSTARTEYDWTAYYGTLPSGIYRICKDITRHFGNGKSETKTIYASFEITA